MRIWIMSDLHLDVGHNNAQISFKLPDSRPEHDVVVIAGDICEDMVKGVKWIRESGFSAPVIYVGGNHEFYRTKIDTNRLKALKEVRGSDDIHILQDSWVEIDGVRFIGATLWTDYCLDGEPMQKLAMRHAEECMNDHRFIRYAAGGYRKWHPDDCLREHQQSVEYIRHMLSEPFDGQQVVVTHHAPSIKSVSPEYKRDLLNGAFASNLDQEVDRADLWIHGHVHTAFDYRIGNGRVVCNPRGYAYHNEHTNFDPSKVVEVVASGTREPAEEGV